MHRESQSDLAADLRPEMSIYYLRRSWDYPFPGGWSQIGIFMTSGRANRANARA